MRSIAFRLLPRADGETLKPAAQTVRLGLHHGGGLLDLADKRPDHALLHAGERDPPAHQLVLL